MLSQAHSTDCANRCLLEALIILCVRACFLLGGKIRLELRKQAAVDVSPSDGSTEWLHLGVFTRGGRGGEDVHFSLPP